MNLKNNKEKPINISNDVKTKQDMVSINVR